MNIFEQASRAKLRFQSIKGEITTEQLWDIPLMSKTGFDLDAVAKAVAADLKGVTEESFVTMARPNPAQARLELKLEIVKHVIAVKLAEQDEREAAAKRLQERARLTEILAKKQDAALESLSVEELQAKLKSLD